MSFRFDKRGTRFRVYLQPRSVQGFEKPQPVRVSARAGTLQPGPSNARMYVVDAVGKEAYKHETTWKTRWKPPHPASERRRPPVEPGPDGHFDHLRPGTRAFGAASVFATVSCVLEIWEHYFGRKLPWFFRDTYDRLEILPYVDSANAWSGEGFLEFGFARGDRRDPFCLNFDAVAHECGHVILKSVIGNPTDDKKNLEYRAHEEGAADIVSLVALLHFDSVVARALSMHKGRLLSKNPLARIGESRDRKARRCLFNDETLSSVEDAWYSYDAHAYSLPFSGAAFDILALLYHDHLRAAGVIPRRPRPPRRDVGAALRETERGFSERFPGAPLRFAEALREAGGRFARMMAMAWSAIRVEGFSYGRAATAVVAADGVVNEGRYRDTIRRLFAERGIPPAAGEPGLFMSDRHARRTGPGTGCGRGLAVHA